MSAYNLDIAAVTRHQIEQRVHEAEARRTARVARHSIARDTTAEKQEPRSRRWVRFTRRAFA